MKCDKCGQITSFLITIRVEELVTYVDDGLQTLLERQQNWCKDCINK